MATITYTDKTTAEASPLPTAQKWRSADANEVKTVVNQNRTDFEDHSARHESGGADEVSHANLAGLQGGSAGERNHLTNAQVSNLPTSAQKSLLAWLSATTALSTNTVALDASDSAHQSVTWESGSRTPTFTGFDTTFRQFVVDIDVSGAPTITWTNVDDWLTGEGSAPSLTGRDVIRVLFESYDSGTTIRASLVGELMTP